MLRIKSNLNNRINKFYLTNQVVSQLNNIKLSMTMTMLMSRMKSNATCYVMNVSCHCHFCSKIPQYNHCNVLTTQTPTRLLPAAFQMLRLIEQIRFIVA